MLHKGLERYARRSRTARSVAAFAWHPGDPGNFPDYLRVRRFLEETIRSATDAAVFSELLLFGGQTHLAKRMSGNGRARERLRIGMATLAQEDFAASLPRRRAVRS